MNPPIMVSAGLPPIPTKLFNRIQDGLFIEMSDLLPDTLTSAEYNAGEDHGDSRKPKHHRELSIMEWVQSFGVYMAVMSRTKPQRIADLLGCVLASLPSQATMAMTHLYTCHSRMSPSITEIIPMF